METQSLSSGALLQITKKSGESDDSAEILSVDEGRWFKSPPSPVEGALSAQDLISEYCDADPSFAKEMQTARVAVASKYYSNETSLRTLRLNKGMTQSELASALDVRQPYIARVEAGRNWPNQDFITRLASYFNKGFGEMCELLPKQKNNS